MKMVLACITLLLSNYWVNGQIDLPKREVHLDSLWSVWHDESQPDTTRLKALNEIIWEDYLYSQPDSAFYFAQLGFDFAKEKELKKYMGFALNIQGVSFRLRGDYAKALGYYQQCLEIREELGDKNGVAGSLNNIGLVYYNQGLYSKAVERYQRSLRIYEEMGDTMGVANILNNLGIIHVNYRDKSKALEYFQRSLKIYEEEGNQKAIADCLNNIGNAYKDQGEPEKALTYHLRSLSIYKEIGEQKGIADCLINIGHDYRSQSDYVKALKNYQESLRVYEQIGDKYGIVSCLTGIGNVYRSQGNYQKAINECKKGLELGMEIESISTQRDACKCLYDAYKAIGNGNKALEYHEQMLILDDSIQTEEVAKQLERIEFQKQMMADSLKQEEEKLRVQVENEKKLRRKSRSRNIAIAGGVFFVLLAGSLYGRVRYIRKSKAIIEKERDRSDNLLLNILPAEIAQELKETGRATARNFEQVSILFTDFKEFTQTSERLTAEELVEEINVCFEAFDSICGKYRIEKIKTIGDAYMAAGGLPIPDKAAAKNTVLAALDMQRFITERRQQLEQEGKIGFQMRAGIHTGSVVAGIVGVRKFQYDIWGDTVNTASRMESHGEIGKVNISRDTYDLLKTDAEFSFESRGKLEVKGKGEVEMYFVTRNAK